jgi:zinc transport system substrate-binding protein
MASESDLAGLVKVLGQRIGRASLGCLVVFLAFGCAKKDAREGPAPTNEQARSVYTVNYPLAYFAERLAPEGIGVVFPAPAGVDPAFWKPPPDVIGRYQRAGLILLNGAGYARWTQYATLPKSRILVTADGCRDRFLPTGEDLTHQHGPGGEHAHEGTAFTTWLDPGLALCQAGHVRDGLVRLEPSSEQTIRPKLEALERDLSMLDARLRTTAKVWGERPMLASHPVYQYLADAYGFHIESVHFEPDEALSPEAIQELDALLAGHPAKLMLWEAKPLPETEQLLRDRDITTVVFDPAAQPPPNGDFLTVMRANVERLACATKAKPCP